MLITGVTDKDTGEHVLDILFGRMRIVLKQPGQKERCSRSVVSAADNTCIDHRLLDDGQMTAVTERIRCHDLASFDFAGQHQI